MVVINLILLATALLVVLLQGFNWFAIWDIAPLLGAAVLAEFLLSSSGGEWTKAAQPKRFCIAGLVAGVVLVALYVHIAWFFDVHGVAQGSSDDGISLIFTPVYTFLGGGVGYVSGYLLSRRVHEGPGPFPPAGR